MATAHGVITDVLSEFGQDDWNGTDSNGALDPRGFGEGEAQLVLQWGRSVGLIDPPASPGPDVE